MTLHYECCGGIELNLGMHATICVQLHVVEAYSNHNYCSCGKAHVGRVPLVVDHGNFLSDASD